MPDDAAPWEQQVYLAEPGAEPAHLDPARDIYSGGGLNICTEPLVRRDENQQIVPALAESWVVADDATYVEFTIRQGAKWSDGQPITSDDFIFAYQHMADPAMANPWAWYYYDIKGFKDANTGAAPVEDIGAEKIDDRTFRVYGNGPTPHLLSLLSYQAAVPVPAHVAKDNPEHWASSIDTFVSGGPWKPVEWEHNRRIVFEPNEYYNGPHQPGVRRIVQTLVPAGSQFDPLNSFLANEVDLLHILNAQQVLTLRSDPKTAELIHSTNNFQSAYL
ncbi:MAG TPA: ABC transporter substrate-binding protein, partial [Marmoricola sp.]|nr:ABC transporter substrate-binding protein [Marmoricola sp.]